MAAVVGTLAILYFISACGWIIRFIQRGITRSKRESSELLSPLVSIGPSLPTVQMDDPGARACCGLLSIIERHMGVLVYPLNAQSEIDHYVFGQIAYSLPFDIVIDHGGDNPADTNSANSDSTGPQTVPIDDWGGLDPIT